jgi:hypothetical protein
LLLLPRELGPVPTAPGAQLFDPVEKALQDVKAAELPAADHPEGVEAALLYCRKRSFCFFLRSIILLIFISCTTSCDE